MRVTMLIMGVMSGVVVLVRTLQEKRQRSHHHEAKRNPSECSVVEYLEKFVMRTRRRDSNVTTALIYFH
jgi:hypothetical protein